MNIGRNRLPIETWRGLRPIHSRCALSQLRVTGLRSLPIICQRHPPCFWEEGPLFSCQLHAFGLSPGESGEATDACARPGASGPQAKIHSETREFLGVVVSCHSMLCKKAQILRAC